MHSEEAGRTELLRLLIGPWLGKALAAAVRIGLPDRLGEEPVEHADLAAELSVRPDPLWRLLRLLAALGVVRTRWDGTTITGMGKLLRADHPSSLRDLVLFYDDPLVTEAWAVLEESVRTGDTAFRIAHGDSVYEHLARCPQRQDTFDAAMAASNVATDGIADAYDFSSVRCLVDVGGGDGTLLAAVLSAHPHLHGVLYERPDTARVAEEKLADHVAAQRCTVTSGDFLEEVPAGGDVYLLCRVLHNWGDTSCRQLLSRCREAMGERSRLLIVERVIPESGDSSLALAFDMHMMVMTGGRERTEGEYETVLRAAGLRAVEMRQLPLAMRMVVATPL
ncbi:O-methyltransferase [Haloactinospora alba]|uniref:O-methyltransferase n=1 Tax=Haloactinospora alba TaxID=405555 RepID=A0A543NI84_9ACTN|nr:methyltransferase [Haloactinospora alba]TQN31552.1 O-methyltransferase [Haloactinospora alba]